MPESLLFKIEGELAPGVTGKDVILHIIGMIGVDGALYQAMEFTGSAIRAMDMDERMSISNMAIEAGGKAGLIEVDDVTRAYLDGRTERPYTEYHSDADATYAKVYEIDAASIVPTVSFPHLPSNTRPAAEARDVKIDQAVIGSCTNGRIADMRQAADVLRGRMATYRFLSRLFRVEVDQELYDTLVSMRFPTNTDNALVDEGYRMICGYLSQADGTVLTELAVDYVRAFIGSGNDGFSAAYPYESVYTSPKRLMMQDARDEVLVLYRAFGLDKQESWKEGEDHIALELEFEQILCERAIRAYEAGDEDECLKLLLSQRNFLEDHLLAWYPMMAADLQKFPQTDFYKGLGKLTDGFLRNDLEFLDAVLSENEADCHPERADDPACHPERRPQAEAEGSRAASAETEVEVA